MRAQAAVFSGTPKSIAVTEVDVLEPAGAEILVRVLGSTLCGSDLHTFEGRRDVACPTILGHEIVGQIVAAGPVAALRDLNGAPLKSGDRVTWTIVANCGTCFFCERDLPQKCLHAVKYGHEQLKPGGFLRGGLADYCHLAAGTSIIRLPEAFPVSIACPASCATATVSAALEAAGSAPQAAVCITGAGMLGLTACAMARARGAEIICCVEPDPARRERARKFGATHAIAPAEIHQIPDEPRLRHGFDLLLEFSGVSAAFSLVWPRIRIGGAAILVGSVFPAAPVPLALEQIVRRQLTVRGVHNYAPRHLAAAVQFLIEHQHLVPWGELVEHWFSLNDVAAAFELGADPSQIRIGVGLGGIH